MNPDVIDKLRKQIKIQPGKPVFDMVFTWIGLGPDLEEVRETATVKWQPLDDCRAWEQLELKIVDAAVNGEASANVLDILPKLPYSSWNEFFYKTHIGTPSAIGIARIEIIVIEGKLRLVVYDRVNYSCVHTMFWEQDDKPVDPKLAKKPKFEDFCAKNAKAIAKIKRGRPKAETYNAIIRNKGVEFSAPSAADAWKMEEPAVILAERTLGK